MLSDFLASIMNHPFPGPGKSFVVKIRNDKNKNQTDLQFTRPDDSDSQLDHVWIFNINSIILIMNINFFLQKKGGYRFIIKCNGRTKYCVNILLYVN